MEVSAAAAMRFEEARRLVVRTWAWLVLVGKSLEEDQDKSKLLQTKEMRKKVGNIFNLNICVSSLSHCEES